MHLNLYLPVSRIKLINISVSYNALLWGKESRTEKHEGDLLCISYRKGEGQFGVDWDIHRVHRLHNPTSSYSMWAYVHSFIFRFLITHQLWILNSCCDCSVFMHSETGIVPLLNPELRLFTPWASLYTTHLPARGSYASNFPPGPNPEAMR
jgi:hypothetical protein